MSTVCASQRGRCFFRLRVGSFSVAARGSATVRSVAIEHPELRGDEVDRGQRTDDEQEDPGQRRRVSHVEAAEAALVEVERVEERGVRRTTGSAADDERLRERLERVDDLQDQVEEDDRREQRQGDLEELADPSRAV